jgi:hypothetical protein
MSAANRDGPNVVNQVVHAATFYGHVARCGCGWKTVHESHIAGLVAGQRHLWNVHGVAPAEESPR